MACKDPMALGFLFSLFIIKFNSLNNNSNLLADLALVCDVNGNINSYFDGHIKQ